MPAKIVVPELGESVVEATVGRWRKKEGDRVTVGEAVVELETEKIDLEVGAEQAGVLARIDRKEGEDVRTGEVLGVIEEAPEEAVEAPKEPVGAGFKPPPADTREETPKETRQALKREEQKTYAGAGMTAKETATPSARRLAREHGVDLARVSSRNDSGRVTEEDVRSHLKEEETVALSSRLSGAAVEAGFPIGSRQVSPATAALSPLATGQVAGSTTETKAPERPTPDRTRREERVRMSRRRLTIARRLVEAQRTAAMLTTFNEIDMSAVMDLRKRRRESFKERHGADLGIVSFFVKASIGALRDFPRLNAEIQKDEMVIKHYYDIGVAIGASEGLVVPVLRDADRMSFAEIEKAIKEYARKAEDGTLSLEDLRGGTFTLTNGGVFGSLLSTPILNPPQVGILGLHKIQERPIPLHGQVVIHPMMYVALTYDHRIVDGLEAVQFLVRVKELVEDPGNLLLV